MSQTLESALVKKPHQQLSYTETQMVEIAQCVDMDTGPEYFCRNFFYIQHPVRGKMRYQPYDYQVDLLNTYHKYKNVVAMLGRQLGKCFTEDINITVRNKTTGKVYEIPIGVFHQLQQAAQSGTQGPDISQYEK